MFACDLGFNRKTLLCNFFGCFVFRFREITHAKMQVFLVANARFTDSIVWKNKGFVWKDPVKKHTAFLHMLFMENKRETSKLK